MRAILALLSLFVLASPLAVAQDAEEKPQSDPERPDDAAWSDCPPDMMCAYDADEPRPYGNESCIECSSPPPSNCMDGAQEGEVCDGDVTYLDGRGPTDCENCRGDAGEQDPITSHAPADGDVTAESADKNAVPFAQLALVIAALAGAVLLVRRA